MILEIILLILAIPAGLVLSHLTKDELVQGRRWFKVLIIISVLSTIWFYLTGKNTMALSSLFIAITTFVSYKKSFTEKL